MNRYDVRSLLGQGAMATVHLAMDRSMDRLVALKILKPGLADIPSARHRFLREATVCARLSHPNIVKLYDAGEADGQLFLAMELVEGQSLGRVLDEHSIPLDGLLRILEETARGVHHAHLQGIVHRDLKPANILVTAKGTAKVTDFGLAHLIEAETTVTQTGALLGTPLFMSPEQARGGAKELTAKSDLYALGVILYLMLTGRTPHEGATTAVVLGMILNRDVEPPRRINPAVPPALDTICMKALERDASRRYASAEALADDLARHLQHQPILTRPPSGLDRAGRWIARRWLPAAVIAVVLALGIVGASAVIVQMRDSARRLELQQQLGTIASVITDRKRELRQLKMSPALARAELEKAVMDTDRFIRRQPDAPQGYYVRARGRLYLGDLEGAERDLATALKLRDDFRPGWSLLGIVKIHAYFSEMTAIGGEFENARTRLFEPILDAAGRAFSKGWGHGKEREEAERWGLPWTREDQVMDGVGHALRLMYHERRPEDAVKFIQDARAQFQAEEYTWLLSAWAPSDKRELLDQVLQASPGFDMALLDRALVRRAAGDVTGALSDIDRVVEIRKTCPYALGQRGSLKRLMGDVAGAVADYQQAATFKPTWPEVWNNLSAAKAAIGTDMEGALADINRAIQLRPDYWEALLNRVRVKRVMMDLDGAIADCNRVLEIKPDYADAYFNRARALEAQGNIPGAMEDLGRAIAAREDYREARCQRAALRLARGDAAGALADFDRAVELNPDDPVALTNRAVAKLNLDRLAEAREDLDRAIALKADPICHFNRAVIRNRLKDVDGAIADLDRTLELKPDHYEAWHARGTIHGKEGRAAQAISDLEKALALAPAGWRFRASVEEWVKKEKLKAGGK